LVSVVTAKWVRVKASADAASTRPRPRANQGWRQHPSTHLAMAGGLEVSGGGVRRLSDGDLGAGKK
jgi:hypothetical protein